MTGEDVRLVLNTRETIGMAKKKLQDQEGTAEPSRQRWYFGGKLLGKIIDTVSRRRHIMVVVFQETS